MKKLVFATNNPHKLEEIRAILGSKLEILSLADIGCDADIPETAETLEGNALIKAHYVYDNYKLDCFADDTGLEVDALHGLPGVHTARYAYPDRHDPEANMIKLLEALRENNDRNARFRTVIALIEKGKEHLFEGVVEGVAIRGACGTEVLCELEHYASPPSISSLSFLIASSVAALISSLFHFMEWLDSVSSK